MSSIKTTELEGDLSVGRHLGLGGNANVQGNATIKKNLKVDGWLEAPNIKGMNKGAFVSSDSLCQEYPKPTVGMTAYVGSSAPYSIYICKTAGKWEDSGETFTPVIAVPTVVETTGDSEDKVMSQKAVTKAIEEVKNRLIVENDSETYDI